MKLLNRHRLRSQRGAAVVEFAIVVPLLLLFFFGIIEFSLLMYNKQVMTNASREGARYGIVSRTPNRTIAEIRDIVKDWADQRLVTFGSDTLDDSSIDVTACNPEPDDNDDCSASSTDWTSAKVSAAEFDFKLKVRITYDYEFLLVPDIPILGTENNLLDVIPLDAETVMNYE